jgi:hypothetical protein
MEYVETSSDIVYSEVPVNVSFTLFVYTRHIDDTLQIIEQIMPLFNPDHIINMDFSDYITGIRIPNNNGIQ